MDMRLMAYCLRWKKRGYGRVFMREGKHSMRLALLGVAMGSAVLLSGCASSLDVVPSIPDTASFIDSSAQVLQPGNTVRVVVFGNDALSGSYALDKQGHMKLGPYGSISAAGLTSAELEQKIAEHLAARGVNNAQVSVMIN